MDMLTTLITNLERFEELEPLLKAMGQRHAGYGVQPGHYETVTSALIWAFGIALEGEFTPELKSAWCAVIEAVERRHEGRRCRTTAALTPVCPERSPASSGQADPGVGPSLFREP